MSGTGFWSALTRADRRPERTECASAVNPGIDRNQLRNLHQEGLGATEIAYQLKIGRSTVYKILHEDKIRKLRRNRHNSTCYVLHRDSRRLE